MNLSLLTYFPQGGHAQASPPGLHIATQPRRSARGRRTDRLILYLSISGEQLLAKAKQEHLLTRLAQTYYKTPGSVTAALRQVAETLNQHLFEQNLRSGGQSMAVLSLLTLKGDSLYLAHCGPSHGYLISGDTIHQYYHPEATPRGLGLGKTTSLHYSQVHLKPGDIIMLTNHGTLASLPAAVKSIAARGLGFIHQYLTEQTVSTVDILLLRANSGPGKVALLSPMSVQEKAATPGRSKEISVPASQSGQMTPDLTSQAQAQTRATQPKPPIRTTISKPKAQNQQPPKPALEIARSPRVNDLRPAVKKATQTATAESKKTPTPRTARPTRKTNPLAPLMKVFLTISRAFNIFFQQLGLSLRTFIGRLLPGAGFFTIPASVMFFIAIAVPLVVVTVATVTYFQLGRAGQYDTYIAQAVQTAGYARTQTEVQARLQAWQAVLVYLDQAEEYQVTADSQALRMEAQQVFDEWEAVTHLQFQPAIANGLSEAVNISRLVASDSDLYMLNANDSSVLRALASGRGYELDPTFQCAPGFPTGQVESFIDIAPAPKGNEFKATVLALDVNGNLLQCIPGEEPVVVPLASPPSNWGMPRAFVTNLGSLYVLDPKTNAVWIYHNGSYDEQPRLFFDAEIPPMEDVIDLAVNEDDLYLLHSDGHITLCTFSSLGVSPTRCIDPVYVDTRLQRENQTLEIKSPFTQILATQPPDPSLFLLEPENKAIYHFSLRLLALHDQFQPQNDLTQAVVNAGNPVTAFTLSPDKRIVFLALSNQVIYAGMP